MGEADKLNVDNIISQLLEGNNRGFLVGFYLQNFPILC